MNLQRKLGTVIENNNIAITLLESNIVYVKNFTIVYCNVK